MSSAISSTSSFDVSSALLTCSDSGVTSTERSARRSTLEPCVPGATIAQERGWLSRIRKLALYVDSDTPLTPDTRAVEFAFQYVREDRTKRQGHIRRSKQQSKLRRQMQLEKERIDRESVGP